MCFDLYINALQILLLVSNLYLNAELCIFQDLQKPCKPLILLISTMTIFVLLTTSTWRRKPSIYCIICIYNIIGISILSGLGNIHIICIICTNLYYKYLLSVDKL